MSQRAPAIFNRDLQHSPLSVPPAQTALLLLDYQTIITKLIPDPSASAKVVETASSVRAWAKSQGIHVYHCIIRFDAEPALSSKMMERWPTLKAMTEKIPGASEIVSALKPDDGEKVTARRLGLLSALSSPELADDLRAKNIKSLICCGISTSAVVLSTVRTANEAGFHVTVVEDACFDPTEGVHESIVKNVLPTSAHVATKDQIIEAWKA